MTRLLPSQEGRPLVIAHRGASALRPENTLPAYELALAQRADMIEIDLHATRDGVIAIAHDAALDRFGASGEIGDWEFEALQTLDAGQGERIPSLDRVLDAFGGRIPFNLELKARRQRPYPGLAAAVLGQLRSRGLLSEMLLSSFYDEVLSELRELSPEARLAVLVSRHQEGNSLKRAEALGAEAINPHQSLASRSFIADAHDAGAAVYPYTVDDPGRMETLLEAGADGLFTNRPSRMRALLEAV